MIIVTRRNNRLQQQRWVMGRTIPISTIMLLLLFVKTATAFAASNNNDSSMTLQEVRFWIWNVHSANVNLRGLLASRRQRKQQD